MSTINITLKTSENQEIKFELIDKDKDNVYYSMPVPYTLKPEDLQSISANGLNLAYAEMYGSLDSGLYPDYDAAKDVHIIKLPFTLTHDELVSFGYSIALELLKGLIGITHSESLEREVKALRVQYEEQCPKKPYAI